MKLKELYKHRTDFTIIGLTGRTGSGCSQISDLLSKDFNNLSKGLREAESFSDPVFKRKFEITKNYLSYGNNWQQYDIIEYKKVLLLYIIKKTGSDFLKISNLLNKYYKENRAEDNKELVKKKFADLEKVFAKYKTLLVEINELVSFEKIKKSESLLLLNKIFFGEDFIEFTNDFMHVLEADGNYFRRTCLLHSISCNIRMSKKSAIDSNTDPNNVYTIAELINKIIKARKKFNDLENKSTKIAIDSLRNSLEITFFKERYSAFYMIATKDIIENSRERLDERFLKKIPNDIERFELVEKLIDLDETEYKNKDFSKGIFTSPNVENCIQKSDYHIFNLKVDQIDTFVKLFEIENGVTFIEKEKISNTFLTREEQLMKLISLIYQPGLITPSASERNMQIAYTAKLNSGCISRQVGAVITDKNFVAKSIGWNDVAKGHTPCNLRNVEDYFNDNILDSVHYSEFEKGNPTSTSDYKYKNSTVSNFKEAIIDYFEKDYNDKKEELNGKNCSFCFKSIHNHYEGESNQVHTRSLHAEENAMLQLTKSGGLGVEHGILFTTASPCELCSKKAYQLGIRIIFYIDPYPGIAVDQILHGGRIKPILFPFSGAIGNSYHKLYEPYLSQKDEITMSLEMNDKNININQFKNILKKIYPKYEQIKDIKSIEDVQMIIEQGLSKFVNNEEEAENL
jgi:deoxycytidylate deaminase